MFLTDLKAQISVLCTLFQVLFILYLTINFYSLQADYFEDYRIEGKDNSNMIYLEVINENLLRALKSGQSAQSIKIKLIKKQTPCLMFEVSLVRLI